MILTPLQDLIYKKGALDFKQQVIKELREYYRKIDIHDEFDNEKVKAQLKILESTISIIEKLQVLEATSMEQKCE